MPELVIIRGIPGTGKTTMAKNDFKSHVHYESDMWFEKNGFDMKKFKDAHEWCYLKVLLAMSEDRNIVVSNTFCRKFEMRAYFKAAMDYGYACRVINLEKEYGSVHDIEDWFMDTFRKRWEPMQDGYLVPGNMIKELRHQPAGYFD